VKNNSFSKHDNRHTTENYGIYLGKGFGKKPTEPHRNQHKSDKELFTHCEGQPERLVSTYVSGYKLRPQESAQRRCSSAMDGSTTRKPTNIYSINSTKETFRRFPQRYSLPKDKEGARPSVNTAWWYGSSPKGAAPAQESDSRKHHQEIKRSENRRCLTSLGHTSHHNIDSEKT
jgi:hypothetical protein